MENGVVAAFIIQKQFSIVQHLSGHRELLGFPFTTVRVSNQPLAGLLRYPERPRAVAPVEIGDAHHDLPGIELKTALKRVKGDAALLKMMLMSFLEKYEHAAGQIEKLLDAGKLRDAKIIVHTIKGVSGNLCADALFIAARELDSALKQDKTGEARSLLEVFARKLAQFTDALKTLNSVDEHTETGYYKENEETDLSQAKEILTEMTALLEKNRSRGWRLLEPLLGLLPDFEFRQEKAALQKAMSALDTEGGISIMLKLSQKLNISITGKGDQE